MNLAICEDNPQHYEIICSILRDLAENTFQTCHFSTGNELLKQFPILHLAVLIPLF